MVLKGTKQFKPYTDNIPTLRNNIGGGVYIIREEGVVVYVGKSNADLKWTLYRHFQKWIDKRSDGGKKWQIYQRVTYYGQDLTKFSVQVYYCDDTKYIDLMETTLIIKLKPRDNKQKLDFYTQEQMNNVKIDIKNMESWNPICEENPF